jgi:hypothetical protein
MMNEELENIEMKIEAMLKDIEDFNDALQDIYKALDEYLISREDS